MSIDKNHIKGLATPAGGEMESAVGRAGDTPSDIAGR